MHLFNLGKRNHLLVIMHMALRHSCQVSWIEERDSYSNDGGTSPKSAELMSLVVAVGAGAITVLFLHPLIRLNNAIVLP